MSRSDCALGAATGGCASEGSEIRRVGGDPPIFSYHGEGEMEAVVSGRLAYLDDERCVVLKTGARRDLAVFPAGSDAHLESDGTLVVDMSGFGPLREGASITGGGGNLSTASGGDLPGLPPGCSSDGVTFAVVQAISDVH